MASQSGGSNNDDVPDVDDFASETGHTASVSPEVRSEASAEVTFRHRTTVKVNRPVYTQLEFRDKYNFTTEGKSKTVSQRLRELARKHCMPSGPCVKKSLLSIFPFIGIMRQYNLRQDIFNDVIAGLTVGIMHIPQGQ